MKHLRKFSSVSAMETAIARAKVNFLGLAYNNGEPQLNITVAAPPIPPTNLVIDCSNNIVTITATNATTLEYNFDGSSTYTTYTQPFEISQTVTVYAKATNSDGSITSSQTCVYINYSEPFYIEDVSGSNNTISIKKNGPAPTLSIEKSLDGVTWESMGTTSTTAITATVPANGKLYLRCDTNNWSNASNKYNYINTSTGNFNVGGNIMSLLYGSSFNGQTAFKGNYTYIFASLFYRTNIVSAAKLLLPATTLYNNCYQSMFQNCTSLTATPALPATTLTNSCYYHLFHGCTALTTAPELPATTLAQDCYYGMFGDCTALTTAPELPATTLVYQCYYGMFYGCTRLNYIKCLATDKSASYCTDNWVNTVAATGTFVKDPNMSTSTWGTGVNGIPTNWTVQDASE